MKGKSIYILLLLFLFTVETFAYITPNNPVCPGDTVEYIETITVDSVYWYRWYVENGSIIYVKNNKCKIAWFEDPDGSKGLVECDISYEGGAYESHVIEPDIKNPAEPGKFLRDEGNGKIIEYAGSHPAIFEAEEPDETWIDYYKWSFPSYYSGSGSTSDPINNITLNDLSGG